MLTVQSTTITYKQLLLQGCFLITSTSTTATTPQVTTLQATNQPNDTYIIIELVIINHSSCNLYSYNDNECIDRLGGLSNTALMVKFEWQLVGLVLAEVYGKGHGCVRPDSHLLPATHNTTTLTL